MGLTFNGPVSPMPPIISNSPLDIKFLETQMNMNQRYDKQSGSNLKKKISFRKFQTVETSQLNETRRSLEKVFKEVPNENYYHHFNRYKNVQSPTNSALDNYNKPTKKMKATFHNKGAKSTLISKISQRSPPQASQSTFNSNLQNQSSQEMIMNYSTVNFLKKENF